MTDLKFAFRQLFKNPGFTLVAVLTLALGIGATTALFSVVYGVLISPYPYAKPGEIWTPGLVSAKANQLMHRYKLSECQEMAKLSAFADVMETHPGGVLLGGEFAPENITGNRVSANAFQFLGVPPLFGRTILPSDIRSTGEPELVTVLSYKRWQKLFGADTSILGKTLRLDDQLYTIIGVMPPRFGWWTDDGLWLPMDYTARDQGVFPIARLKRGIRATAAREQLHALQLELAKMDPSGFPKEEFKTTLTNYLDITQASGTMQRSIQLLFGAVGLLLLIACANVANLQLAKATARAREMAIRLSVGASRSRLIRQLLTESVLVSVLGGLLGLLFAFWLTQLIVALIPSFRIPNESRIEVNWTVSLFCLAVSVLTGIVFGLAPALQSSRPNLADSLKDEARGTGITSGRRTRAVLVIAEVALSVVLLVSAGLTVRGFVALRQAELGFRPERVIALDLPLSPKRYATLDQRNNFARELLQRTRNLPEVQAATIGNGGLPFNAPDSNYTVEGQEKSEDKQITFCLISEDYFRTLAIPLRRGRVLSDREVNSAQPLAVINEAAVKLWPAGEDPLGRRIHLDRLENPGSPVVLVPTNSSGWMTIVGIVGDTRNDGLTRKPQPELFVPYTLVAPPGRTLAVRTSGDPKRLANALRAQVCEMDKEQPLNGPTTFNEILAFETAQSRFAMSLFTLFATLGLALAMAGIYSVLSYIVSRRTREIGVRMALGAQRQDVLRLILRTGGGLVGAGMLIGILASFAAAQLLTSQLGELFQIRPADPVSFVVVIVLLGIVAAAACLFPARRATRVDPMEALRYE